ncbi:hypothetical protein KP509_19G052100 [Ceratopteris richardii]|nr:hypothetical protein KP509_19G052100 [Ceratopteris richardii]
MHSELLHRSVYSYTSLISGYTEHGRTRDALDCFEKMVKEHVDPNECTFLSALKACAMEGDLNQGRILHAYVCMKGLLSNVKPGNAVLNMYTNCGALLDAEQVFSTMEQRDVLSWDMILSLFVDEGKAEKAVDWYMRMKSDVIKPSSCTFVVMFKACEIIADLNWGQILHDDAYVQGCVSNTMVASSMLNMYGKLNALGVAENVFVELPHSDVVIWNTMLSIYVRQGLGNEALLLFRQMQDEDVEPTHRTYIVVLRALSILAEQEDVVKGGWYEIGQAVHADACKKGFLAINFLHNTLMNMYRKCRAIVDMEHVFASLVHRDRISWNTMLSGYTEVGQGSMALRLLPKMDKEGIIPDQTTFAVSLQAVAVEEDRTAVSVIGHYHKQALEIGHALHGDACRFSLDSDVVVSTALLTLYGKCGSISEAEHVFFHAPIEDNTPIWNAMISVYIESGVEGKALQLYTQMQREGCSVDEITLILVLQACGMFADKEYFFSDQSLTNRQASHTIGQALHADILKGDFSSDVSVGNTLINFYGKCGALLEAENVFCSLSYYTVASWNAMISAYAEQDEFKKALLLYAQMRRQAVRPDALTFICTLQACSALAEKVIILDDAQTVQKSAFEIGQALYSDCEAEGFSSQNLINSSFLRLYGKCGAIMEAEQVFRDLDPVERIFSESMSTWNLFLSIYAENGCGLECVQLYRLVQKLGISISFTSVLRLLQACNLMGNLVLCQELHFLSVSSSIDGANNVIGTLIHAYGGCASMIDAESLLKTLVMPDAIACGACISGYAGVGDSIGSMHIFDGLQLMNVQPSSSTFVSILAACTQSGLLSGSLCFESMVRDFGLIPEVKHYCCLVDLYGRAGDLRRVQNMLEKEIVHNSLITWLSLLGAAHTHSNSVMAKQAYDHAMTLEPNQVAAYVLMSNICADSRLQSILNTGQEEEYMSMNVYGL